MTDPNRHVPSYHDPHGTMGTFDNMLMSNESFDISIDDYEHTYGDYIMFNEEGNNDHLSRLESPNTQFVHGTSQAGTSGVGGQSSGHNEESFDPESSDFGNPVQLPVWPVRPEPYSCSYCQVLREIIHTKEGERKKLEIHGRLGMICHGILEICSGNMTAPNKEYHMFEFCKKSISDVKQFLVKYCEEHTEADYTRVKDPLLTFYDALCVGSDWDWDFDDILPGSPGHIGRQLEGTNQPDVHQPQGQSDEARTSKKAFKEQREMIKNLKVRDLVPYFNLPECDAAKCLGVSSTVVKHICRKEGLSRWPYRKVKSIEKKMEDVYKSMQTANAKERAEAGAEIWRLQLEVSKISGKFL